MVVQSGKAITCHPEDTRDLVMMLIASRRTRDLAISCNLQFERAGPIEYRTSLMVCTGVGVCKS
jgi:hypothetical protein